MTPSVIYPSAEAPRGAPVHPTIEDELHLAGPPDVQVLADDLLEEDVVAQDFADTVW